jgi:hypothetical protein
MEEPTTDPLRDYMEAHNIDEGALNGVYQMAQLPFDEIFTEAVAHDEVFDGGTQFLYSHLPYDVEYGNLLLSPPRRLLWKCRWCNFWCDMLDQRVLEQHLLVYCIGITDAVRDKYKRRVFNQMCHHIETIGYSLKYVDHDLPVRCVSPSCSD